MARTVAWAKTGGRKAAKTHSNHLHTWTGVAVILYFHESDFGGLIILV